MRSAALHQMFRGLMRALPFVAASSLAHAASPCLQSAEEAALRFVKVGASAPAETPALLRQDALKRFRARLEQLLDDRYSPASATLREQWLGTGWSPGRIKAASDEELVSRYLSARSAAAEVSDLKVVSHESSRVFGDEVTVAYQVRQGTTSTSLERKLSVFREGECWRVDTPLQAWAQLEHAARILKAARTEPPPSRQGPPMVSLKVAAASEDERPGMQRVRRRGASGSPRAVWISDTPLLTESDVSTAAATWDCEAGLGPEPAAVKLRFTEEAGERFASWTKENVGQMMAVVIEGEAWVFARVLTPLSKQLVLCSSEASLDDAQALARRLMGAPSAKPLPEQAR